MQPAFDLPSYLNLGAENLISDVLRTTLQNPKETLFLHKFHRCQAQMEKLRTAHEAAGLHVPVFLIASVTNACNLYCKGCYARANGLCGESKGELLTQQEWNGIFTQAETLGIPFILLAGGEPFLRRDVLQAAAEHSGVLFPIFTNGTVMDEEALRLLNKHRNLVPVVSLEGNEQTTNDRRGLGAYTKIWRTIHDLSAK
jgi:MoaA/NifB/PqqE/SkfB family radical SAM enzyme